VRNDPPTVVGGVRRWQSLCALGKEWRSKNRNSSDPRNRTEANDIALNDAPWSASNPRLRTVTVAYSRSPSPLAAWLFVAAVLLAIGGCCLHCPCPSVDCEHVQNCWKYHGLACRCYPYSCPPCPYYVAKAGWNLPFPLGLEDELALAKAAAGQPVVVTSE
jgi:hypothetical protein